MGERKRWITAIAAAGALAICGTAALLPGDFHARLGLATRLTARWSALWFLAAFTAQPLFQMLGQVWAPVLRNRRYIGLGFAFGHTVHGGALSWLILSGGASRGAAVWIGGGLAYLLMWAMAATSNDAAMRALGKNWKLLHTLGLWWLWIVFTNSYFGRIFRPETQFLGMAMTALFVAAALIRIPAVRQALTRRRPETA
ncbi:MAG: hypothetical protein EOP60_02475 [Sphingomonadales bacterium]|nr:MAG: hypothetical protein EOP60_02475 [Sphingomonadales bacterium]